MATIVTTTPMNNTKGNGSYLPKLSKMPPNRKSESENWTNERTCNHLQIYWSMALGDNSSKLDNKELALRRGSRPQATIQRFLQNNLQ